MKVHGTSKKYIYILKQCNFIECQDIGSYIWLGASCDQRV